NWSAWRSLPVSLANETAEPLPRRRLVPAVEVDQGHARGFAAYSSDTVRRQGISAMGTNPGATRALVGIVDDDPAVRNSLKFSLELEGFAVGTFANAAELLRAPDLSRFQCLVVDFNMPGMDGIELAVKLREMQFAAPVILITSDPSKALITRADR